MSTTYTLYAIKQHPNTFKILIAASISKVHVQLFPDFVFNMTNRTDEFLKLNPFGKVPTLKISTKNGAFDDASLYESNAIARYIASIGEAKAQLLGANPLEEAKINAWIDVITYSVQAFVYPLYAFKFGFFAYDEEKFKECAAALANSLSAIEKSLGLSSFLLKDKMTLADIILGCIMLGPLTLALDAEYRRPFPKLEAYFRRIYDQPEFVSVVGETKFLEKLEL